MKFSYFPVFAKGPSIALALEFSGLDWEGSPPADFAAMKQSTPWGHLPVLEVPDLGMIGQEIAILNYIGRKAPAMAGEGDKDFTTSQQLLQQAEDIYAKLGLKQDTIMVKDKVPKEELEAFWTATDKTLHNKKFGLHVLLEFLEAFYQKASPAAGSFTASGKTVGECKLWATLHMLVMIKGDVLDSYAGLKAFHQRLSGEKETQELLTNGGRFPHAFKQYFV